MWGETVNRPQPDAQGAYRIIYPRNARVQGATLLTWAQDEESSIDSIEAAIEFLDDAGLVTFAR